MYNYYQHQEPSAYFQAQRIVRAKLRFYRSLTSYVVVNVIVFLVWLAAQNTLIDLGNTVHVHDANYPWFLWILIPWGIGLSLQYLNAFVLTGRSSQRMIETEMQKMGLTTPAPTAYQPTTTEPYHH
jgi:hypothetical protein